MGVAGQGRVTSLIAVLLDLMKERFGLLLSPVPLILDIRFIGIQPTALLADCRLSLRKGCRGQILIDRPFADSPMVSNVFDGVSLLP
jgi:hypothetical protein